MITEKAASNIDRLARLSPSMIKLAIDYIHKSPRSFHHRAYINSLASFAEHVGIEVLCEGIETPSQLDVCIETGGRYFQGFLLARPQPHLSKAVVDTSVLAPSTGRLIATVRNKVSQANALRRSLDNYVLCYVAENLFIYGKSDADKYLRGLLHVLPKNVLRLFLCNSEGVQVAGNTERREDSVVSTVPAGVNWVWRGFFQEAMYMFASGQQSGVTGAYRDMLTKERIFTYFTTMGNDLFLFVDVRRMALSVASFAEPSVQHS
jgi:hypothetical protein